MRAALSAVGLVGVLFAGMAQADGGWGKNHRLIQDCRQVLFKTEPDRRKYLERELFQYEMSFASNQTPSDRLVHEENLRETCQVVAKGSGLPDLRLPAAGRASDVARPTTQNVRPSRLGEPRETAAHAPVQRINPDRSRGVRVVPLAAAPAWQRPLFEPSEAPAANERWHAPAAAVGDSGLRRLLQIR